MKVWIFNHYAEGPEGMVSMPFDIARELVRRGNSVSIFAASFSHYSFRETRRYGARLWRREIVDGVEFVWIRTSPYRFNDLWRLLNMLSYFVVATIAGSLRRRPTHVIGVSVHPLAALAGRLVAARHRSRFLVEITDLWPQVLIDFGRISAEGITARILRQLERFLYSRADSILMRWKHTEPYVERLGVSPGKVVWFPHGVRFERYRATEEEREAYASPFLVMYTGGFVDNNDTTTILQAARLLLQRGNAAIRFALVGSGTNKAVVMAAARQMGLTNVEFPATVPKSRVGDLLGSADALVYAVRDLPVYRYGISMNKLADYLACGKPVIFAGRSTYDPVSAAGAGISVPPGQPTELADAIEHLWALTPNERAAMGRRGRAYAEKHHSIAQLGERLIDTLSSAGRHPIETMSDASVRNLERNEERG